MQTIAADPIEMKESAAMTCPTKRRNSPIASHFGEKASPQRVGAPATGPPNPKQARPKQHDHPNPAGPTKATGPPKPKQQDRPNQSSPEQSKSPTKTTTAPTTATGPPKPGSTNHSNRTIQTRQHQPQQQDHPNPAGPNKATGSPKPKQPRTKQKPHQSPICRCRISCHHSGWSTTNNHYFFHINTPYINTIPKQFTLFRL